MSKPSNEELLKLLAEFVWSDDPCQYDHHGYCQSHNLHDNPCPHERAKVILEANAVPYDK